MKNDDQPKFSMLDLVEFLSSDSCSDTETEDEGEEEEEKREENNNGDLRCNTTPQQGNVGEEEVSEIDGGNSKKHVNTHKMEAKKKEVVAMIRQLQTHIVALEKEKKSLLHSRKQQHGQTSAAAGGEVYVEMNDLEMKYNEERKKEKADIQQNLTKISTKIEKFKRNKEDARKCPSKLEKLKELMEDIEENVMAVKEKQKLVYEELMCNEKTLGADLNTFHNKLNTWQQQTSNSDIPLAHTDVGEQNKKEQHNTLRPKEVSEFEEFLVLTGGHQGGWDDIDHQTFLKIQKQFKKQGIAVMLEACVNNIPVQSREDIKEHIDWYEEYCILRERKREAIVLWKNLKQNEREDLVKHVELNDIEEEKRRKKKEIRMEKEREQRFIKLQQHKLREQELQAREKQIKDEAERKLKEKNRIREMEEERKRVELKSEVEEFRNRRREEEEVLKNAQEQQAKCKQTITQQDKERILQRNERMFSTKQQAKQKEEEERVEKEKRLQRLRQQVHVEVDRDPARLYQLTAGWKQRKQEHEEEQERCKQQTVKGARAGAGAGVNTGARLMPHRAVPTWRQGANR